MNKGLEEVKEFHDVFGHLIGTNGKIPNKDILKLRFNLLIEELFEYADAADIQMHASMKVQEEVRKREKQIQGKGSIHNNIEEGVNVDQVGVLDSLGDMQYILNGTVIVHGFHEVFDEACSEIHRSNMTKVCETNDEVQRTIGYHIHKGEKENEIHPVEKELNGKTVYVLKRKDGKILKASNYSRANLKSFVKWRLN